ncbi:WXG100 family type VII secretion target [Kitasatospora sp. NPDC091335]|uniref:WXG100 family type VII secretion target n=1 Tax=Kitasatospora sp. NPDC091335 TaxID=3364085 RepID=UPI003830CE8B
MDFGNIHLHHETVEQSANELRAAGSMMQTNLKELLSKLSAVIDNGHFQGVAATAFHEFSAAVSANDQQMEQDITAAAATLDRMHETMKESDTQAGKQFA